MKTPNLDNEILFLEDLGSPLNNYQKEHLKEYKAIKAKLNSFAVFDKIKEWGEQRDLIVPGNEGNQLLKTIEEVAELAEVIDANGNNTEYASESGGVMVTVILGQLCKGLDPIEALNLEFDRISNRKGKVLNGQFVKAGKSNSKRKGLNLLISKAKGMLRLENVKNKG